MIVQRNIAGTKTTQEYQQRSGRITSTSGGAFTIETHCISLIFEIGKLIDATATLVATIANSTAYPGTLTVAYTIPSGKTLQYFIQGTNGYTDAKTVATTGTDDNTDIP